MRGQVLWGSNSIFYIQAEGCGSGGVIYECRLKGKKLLVSGDEYNPLAPGDWVDFEPEAVAVQPAPATADTLQVRAYGMITGRQERQRWLERWNKKRNAPQIIVSNVDLLVIVACVQSPPFRPRFVDRCLVAASARQIPVLIILNKADLGIDDSDAARILHYQSMGYQVMLTSVELGEGLDILRTRLNGTLSAFVGQSGVGKSSLLSALDQSIQARVGYISSKYNRGTHTTTMAKTYLVDFAKGIIDTPGIRGLELTDADERTVAGAFPDFGPFIEACGRYNCVHREEPDCAITQAVAAGKIPADRYDSYRRIIDDQGD